LWPPGSLPLLALFSLVLPVARAALGPLSVPGLPAVGAALLGAAVAGAVTLGWVAGVVPLVFLQGM
jgi:hypothetical protein